MALMVHSDLIRDVSASHRLRLFPSHDTCFQACEAALTALVFIVIAYETCYWQFNQLLSGLFTAPHPTTTGGK